MKNVDPISKRLKEKVLKEFYKKGSFLSMPDDADWAFGRGDFTISAWHYVPVARKPSTLRMFVDGKLIRSLKEEVVDILNELFISLGIGAAIIIILSLI